MASMFSRKPFAKIPASRARILAMRHMLSEIEEMEEVFGAPPQKLLYLGTLT